MKMLEINFKKLIFSCVRFVREFLSFRWRLSADTVFVNSASISIFKDQIGALSVRRKFILAKSQE